jgi:hypothetical protein
LGKALDYKQHYDLVEQMTYLFVRVVRAQGLMGKYEEGKSDPVSNWHLSSSFIHASIDYQTFQKHCQDISGLWKSAMLSSNLH